jgi:hypothetical protein
MRDPQALVEHADALTARRLDAKRQEVKDLIWEIAANELRLSIFSERETRLDLCHALELQTAHLSSALIELTRLIELPEFERDSAHVKSLRGAIADKHLRGVE